MAVLSGFRPDPGGLMRTFVLVGSILASAALAGQRPPAAALTFEGTWTATDPTSAIAVISISHPGEWIVDVMGSCDHPDCRWWPRRLALLKTTEHPDVTDRGVASWVDGHFTRRGVFDLSGEKLVADITTVSHDGNTSLNSHQSFTFVRVSRAESASSLETVVTEAYRRELGIVVPHAAIINDPRYVDCSDRGHLVTTTYLRTSNARAADLFVLYALRDGASITKRLWVPNVLAPVGTIRVLSIVVRHPETAGLDPLLLWSAAQRRINDDHVEFARSRGYKTPLVVFENENLTVDPTELQDRNNPAAVSALAAAKGQSPSRFQIVMTINIDPTRGEGGLSRREQHSIYVGNYANWKTPLSARDWMSIARTAYHHEMAHHWGWDHDWTPICGGTPSGHDPFVAPPILFGWEDVDGDGVPEILDDTPYGRPR
jgi:hypothetical protein